MNLTFFLLLWVSTKITVLNTDRRWREGHVYLFALLSDRKYLIIIYQYPIFHGRQYRLSIIKDVQILMTEQISNNAEKILNIIPLIQSNDNKNKLNFLKMMLDKMSVDVKFICQILILSLKFLNALLLINILFWYLYMIEMLF